MLISSENHAIDHSVKYAHPPSPLDYTCYKLGLLFDFQLRLRYVFNCLLENAPCNIVSNLVWRRMGPFSRYFEPFRNAPLIPDDLKGVLGRSGINIDINFAINRAVENFFFGEKVTLRERGVIVKVNSGPGPTETVFCRRFEHVLA